MATLPLQFKSFSLKSVNRKHMYCLVLGCSGSGKSYLVKDLLYQLSQDNYWREFYLVSPTEHLSHSFNMFDPKNIRESFDEEWLSGIIQERVRQIRSRESIKPMLIVLDDCQADSRIRHSPSLNKLFVSGRHLKVGCFILLQNVNAGDSVPPALRSNATLLCIFRPRKEKDRKYVVREWFSMGSEKEGEEALLRLTAGEHNVAICNLQEFATAEKLEDFIYSYHAQEVPAKFTLHGAAAKHPKKAKQADLQLASLDFQ